jgi:hypothetical protein
MATFVKSFLKPTPFRKTILDGAASPIPRSLRVVPALVSSWMVRTCLVSIVPRHSTSQRHFDEA